MEELVMIGFTEKLRAVEVLPQLQRLTFDWSADLRTAVAVEVEKDGKVRLHNSQLLDAGSGLNDALQWKAILSAIIPLPHMRAESPAEIASQVRLINAEGSDWLKSASLDRDFIRNAAALLRPGHSAILAVLRDPQSALRVLLGYSQVVLHTSFVRSCSGSESDS